jgi:hypothetical protein
VEHNHLGADTVSYYTYAYLREDGSPYYIGKGKGQRAFDKHNGFSPPSNLSRIRIYPMLDEDTALAYERYLIDFWGRKDIGTGILWNRTDGGENPPKHFGNQFNEGRKHSRKPLAGISAAGGRAGGRKNAESGQLAEARQKIPQGHSANLGKIYGKKNAENGVLVKARHSRWHTKRGIHSPDCAICKEFQ